MRSIFIITLLMIATLPFAIGQDLIPEPTKSCTAEVAEWWRQVRAAGRDAAEASVRKDQAIREAGNRSQSSNSRGNNEDDVLSRKDRDRLDADIAAARTKYSELLREGQEKSYSPPIGEHAGPITLYRGIPRYTEQARHKDISGQVNLRVEFRADGAIGDVQVMSGLGYGLDENAVKAIRQMIFLPAIKDGAFLTVSRTAYAEFNLMRNYRPPGRGASKPNSVGKSSLPAPSQISPASGTVFDHYPRETTLRWTEVTGAASYVVEIDFYSYDSGWISELDPNRTPKPATHIERDLNTTTYKFNFVGAQPGRWRVWVVDRDGNESAKTDWWIFRYTR